MGKDNPPPPPPAPPRPSFLRRGGFPSPPDLGGVPEERGGLKSESCESIGIFGRRSNSGLAKYMPDLLLVTLPVNFTLSPSWSILARYAWLYQMILILPERSSICPSAIGIFERQAFFLLSFETFP